MPSSLFALLDDIATILDDVAVLTKITAKKTAGVLGDDLALNAQQVAGVAADRELPVVWAVAKGSALNKAILVPTALAISAFAPWLITPLLMTGGAYLCFEGVEKLAHKLFHRRAAQAQEAELKAALANPQIDLVALEREKIRGAVRTDFVLSAEIIVISLGAAASAAFVTQALAVCGVAILMTVAVYGLVAGIVKLDDFGVHLSSGPRPVAPRTGAALLGAAPYLMKGLSVAGTIAMFLVGGGILAHGIAAVHQALEEIEHAAGPLGVLAQPLGTAFIGVVAGAVVLAGVTAIKRLVGRQ